MSRVVVIGAGVGGLAAAARLAAAGHEVSVFERAETVGGKLGRYIRHTPAGDFHFDTGPSLLTLPQVFTDLFEATGAKLDEYLDLVPLDPIVRHVFPTGDGVPPLDARADRMVLDSCADSVVFAERVGALFGERAAADWQRLWQRAARVWDASWRDVLSSGIDSPLSLAKLAWRLGDLAAIGPGQTLRGLGRRYLHQPQLRMLLDRYATYTGADPRRAPAALVAVPYAELAFGGWYLRGGLGTLADALLSRCLDLGVVVQTGTTVTAIDAAGGRVHGVRLAGVAAPVRTDVVVANIDALSLYRDLLPRPDQLARLTDRSLAGFVLLLGVRGGDERAVPDDQAGSGDPVDPGDRIDSVDQAGADNWTGPGDQAGRDGRVGPDCQGGPGRGRDAESAGEAFRLAHHNVFFPTDYDAEFDAVFGDAARGVPARPALDPTVFVTVADDPAVRPADHQAWFVLVNAARHGTSLSSVDWRRPGLAEAYADRILDVLAGRGVDVRDRLVFREVRTPADLAEETAAPGGAIYGTAGGLLRPANRGPVAGLFLVGGSVHPGGGLPMVTLSAQIVADRIGPA